MGIKTDTLNRSFRSFIQNQPVFFVATAAPDSRVNLSPKGLDSLRVISDTRLIWLSVSGSGNETAAHVLQSPRMALMFCALTGDALILRVYGSARVVYPRDPGWAELYAEFPDYAGARNIFDLRIDLVTTSCGTGVPEMSMRHPRAETELLPWFATMSPAELQTFWDRKNTISLDGTPTGI